jgi:hypothetical protein
MTGTSSDLLPATKNGNIPRPVFLHSECSHAMISTELYERHFLPIDREWSQTMRPYGIHYCGADPHRFAPPARPDPVSDSTSAAATSPRCEALAEHVSQPVVSPVEIPKQTPDQYEERILFGAGVAESVADGRLLHQHGPSGDRCADISAIFEEVEMLCAEYRRTDFPQRSPSR